MPESDQWLDDLEHAMVNYFGETGVHPHSQPVRAFGAGFRAGRQEQAFITRWELMHGANGRWYLQGWYAKDRPGALVDVDEHVKSAVADRDSLRHQVNVLNTLLSNQAAMIDQLRVRIRELCEEARENV